MCDLLSGGGCLRVERRLIPNAGASREGKKWMQRNIASIVAASERKGEALVEGEAGRGEGSLIFLQIRNDRV